MESLKTYEITVLADASELKDLSIIGKTIAAKKIKDYNTWDIFVVEDYSIQETYDNLSNENALSKFKELQLSHFSKVLKETLE